MTDQELERVALDAAVGLIHYLVRHGILSVVDVDLTQTFLESVLSALKQVNKEKVEKIREVQNGSYFCRQCGYESEQPLTNHKCIYG